MRNLTSNIQLHRPDSRAQWIRHLLHYNAFEVSEWRCWLRKSRWRPKCRRDLRRVWSFCYLGQSRVHLTRNPVSLPSGVCCSLCCTDLFRLTCCPRRSVRSGANDQNDVCYWFTCAEFVQKRMIQAPAIAELIKCAYINVSTKVTYHLCHYKLYHHLCHACEFCLCDL